MAGKKKEQRRQRKAAKAAAQPPNTADGSSSSSSKKVVRLPPDEFFAKLKEEVLNQPKMGNAVDGMFRSLHRTTFEKWTHDFGALPTLIGKNFLFLQLFLIDEDRVIQGKFHGLGGKLAFAENHMNIVQRSRNMFKEAVPFLRQGGGVDHWVFSRSKWVSGYNCLVDDASDFSEYDPLHSLMELPVDVPSGVRCTEAFLILAGDFEDRGGGFSTRGAVVDLLHELTSTEGQHKLLGFGVCCSSVQVGREKISEMKDEHMTA